MPPPGNPDAPPGYPGGIAPDVPPAYQGGMPPPMQPPQNFQPPAYQQIPAPMAMPNQQMPNQQMPAPMQYPQVQPQGGIVDGLPEPQLPFGQPTNPAIQKMNDIDDFEARIAAMKGND